MLKTNRSRGQKLVLGFGDVIVEITIKDCGRNRVEFAIDAPDSVTIYKPVKESPNAGVPCTDAAAG